MTTRRDDVRNLATAISTVSRGLQRWSRRSRAVTTLSALQAVAAKGPIRPGDIAAEIDLHHSSITRQIQALKEQGLVEVGPDPVDRRASTVTLTECGAREMDRLVEIGVDRFMASSPTGTSRTSVAWRSPSGGSRSRRHEWGRRAAASRRRRRRE